jgi:hypothetical protein
MEPVHDWPRSDHRANIKRKAISSALQKLAEEITDANGSSSRADGGQAGADELCGGGIHFVSTPLFDAG